VFLLTFRSDYSRLNHDQFIDLQTGHIQIVPPDSPLVKLDSSFDNWLRSLPEVKEAAPVITRYGTSYNLDSESESWMSLIAVPAERQTVLFLSASVTEGSGDIRLKSFPRGSVLTGRHPGQRHAAGAHDQPPPRARRIQPTGRRANSALFIDFKSTTTRNLDIMQ